MAGRLSESGWLVLIAHFLTNRSSKHLLILHADKTCLGTQIPAVRLWPMRADSNCPPADDYSSKQMG
jgi:hypothetical protein